MRRRLILTLALFVLLLIAGAALAPSLIDWGAEKSRVASFLAEQTGLTVQIDGKLDLALLPTPAFTAAGVTLTDPASSATLTATSIDLRLSFTGLLAGRAEITSLVAIDPKIAADQAAWQPFLDRLRGQSSRLAVRRLLIVDGVVAGPTGSVDPLAKINVELLVGEDNGPVTLDGTAEVQGIPVAVKAIASGLDRNGIAALTAKISLAEETGELRYSGSIRHDDDGWGGIGRLHAETRKPSALLARLGLQMVHLPEDSLVVEAHVSAANDAVKIEDLEVTFGDQRASGEGMAALGDAPALQLKLGIARLVADGWSIDLPDTLSAAGISGPPFKFDLDMTAQGVQWHDRVIRQVHLDIGMEPSGRVTVRQAAAEFPGGVESKLTGTLDPGDGDWHFVGHIDAGADNMRPLLDWLGVDVAALGIDRLHRVAFATNLNVSRAGVSLADLDLGIDDMRLGGSFGLIVGAVPKLTAALKLDHFDLVSYPMPIATLLTLDAADLRRANADITLRVATISAASWALSDVVVQANLLNGDLAVTEGAATLMGAKLAVTGSLTEAPSLKLEMTGTVTGFDAGRLGVSLLSGPDQHGRLAIDGTIGAVGPTLGAVVTQLAGDGHFTLTEASLAPLDLASAGRMATSRLPEQDRLIEIESFLSSGRTDGVSASGAWHLGSAALQIDQAPLKVGAAELAKLSGDVDLAAGAADLHLLIPAQGAQALRFRMQGPIDGAVRVYGEATNSADMPTETLP